MIALQSPFAGEDTLDAAALEPVMPQCSVGRPLFDRQYLPGKHATTEEALAAQLEAKGHRVLRPIPPLHDFRSQLLEHDIGIVVALDIESTGIGSEAEVIELAMIRFAYSITHGTILGLVGTFSALRQPSQPIPAEVSKLTGIDDAMVAGSMIEAAEVSRFVAGANLIVAHNAAFDRPLAEASWPVFKRLPWACSCKGVDWKAEGFAGSALGYLLVQAGFHHHGHRALADVAATIHLLSLKLPASARGGFAALLERARAPSYRIWAQAAPFAAKDRLRARNYRWSDGRHGLPRAWFIDVAKDELDLEVGFLRQEIYRASDGHPLIEQSTAMNRFSDRRGTPCPATPLRKA